MRQKIDFFAVEGKPLLLPDGPVEVRCADVLSPESGRDESGRMHRFVLRDKLRSWKFTYRDLTQEEKIYLENLFAGKGIFSFTHPADDRENTKTDCSCEDFSLVWRSWQGGIWGDMTFRVTQV